MISSTDPLELNEIVRDMGLDLAYKQLTAGKFLGEITLADMDNVIAFRETQTTSIQVQGSVDTDSYFFIFNDLAQEGIKFNGIDFQENQLTVYSPGTEFHCATSTPIKATQLLIPRGLLDSKINRRLQDDHWEIDTTSGLLLEPEVYRQLLSAITTIIDTHQGHRNGCVDLIADSLIQSHSCLAEKSSGRPPQYNIQTYKTAIDYIHEHLDKSLTIDSLCDYTQLSQRQLDRVFHKHTSMSIGKYINITKLNSIKKELAESSKNETTVYKKAKKYSINHLGRFSSNYFNFFGEYPSETLKNTRK